MNKQSLESSGNHRRKRRRKRRRSRKETISSASITNTTTTISIAKFAKIARSVLLVGGTIILIMILVAEYQKFILSSENSKEDSTVESTAE